MMVRPELVQMQEIKVGSKAKIIDMVAIRHNPSSGSNGENRTTVILLCEDGSLKIYMACANATEFWLSPAVCHPMAALVNQARRLTFEFGGTFSLEMPG